MNIARILSMLMVAVLLASAVTGSAAAQSASGDDLYESLEEMVPLYNDNADSVDLGPVSIAGTSNIYIQDGESVVTYSMTMDKQNRITDLADTPSEDAKRKITTDRATIEQITTASNPAVAFRDAVANDDIVITGEDGQTVEKIKWAVINAFKGFFI
ncbi:hypothetical protein halTADL_1882 [Halohasta litchfieldiae]|jgi:hypothetical protein|uniref:Uncharacterized protein n=1 Tax=Halohasta litchfieldiae TaxID=1073996 RepID=A0A1H6QVB9_9EURY|nr:hypothetical protein [Halohasta litchfieldiae]ATW88635.1 hypothetical protein halTADL_1882 [Halohasta litchfieldiae]SEI47651.1 hypothetical protein SAMN05444271_10183 [Halohasta litchfieldiae]